VEIFKQFTFIYKSLFHKLSQNRKLLNKIKIDKNIYLLLGIFFLIIILMLPFQDQLFSDDFAYAQSVRHLLQTQQIKVSEWVAPTSITHILWGAIFAWFIGFSLSSLHLSQVILIPILIISFYKLITLNEKLKSKALPISIFFLSIPWIIYFAYTFMTTISFLTLEVLALLFYLKGLLKRNTVFLLLAGIFSSAAFLTRQLGIIIPLAAAFSLLLYKDKSKPEKFLLIAASVIIPFITVIIYVYWLSIPGNKTSEQYFYQKQTLESLSNFLPFSSISLDLRITNFTIYFHRILNYLSLVMGMFFPITATLVVFNIKIIIKHLKNNDLLVIISASIFVLAYFIDVILFRDTYTAGFNLDIYQYETLFKIPWAYIWKYEVILSIPFWSVLIVKSFRLPKRLTTQENFLLFCFFGLSFLILITANSWSDYILPLLPIIFIWFFNATSNFIMPKKFTFILISLLLIDSIQITKLRYDEGGFIWRKSMKLVNAGVSPLQIDQNQNFAWLYWFYYEQRVNEAIENANGDKSKMLNHFSFPNAKPKYFIYTNRMIGYSNLDLTKYKYKIIPIQSLFVRSNIYLMELNER